MEVLAWKRALSSPSRDDDIGASITVQEALNSKDTRHGHQEKHFGIRGEVQRTKYLGP